MVFATVPPHLGSDLLCVAAFGTVLVALVALGSLAVDWTWRGLDLVGQVQRGNMAAGLVLATVVGGLCYATAAVVRAVVGGP